MRSWRGAGFACSPEGWEAPGRHDDHLIQCEEIKGRLHYKHRPSRLAKQRPSGEGGGACEAAWLGFLFTGQTVASESTNEETLPAFLNLCTPGNRTRKLGRIRVFEVGQGCL